MCLDAGEVRHGCRQEHRSGCDVTPAGVCCFQWRGPSNCGGDPATVVLSLLGRGSVLNAVGSFACLCGQQLD